MPGQAFGDVDGITKEVVNCRDLVIRDSELLSLDRETWNKHIGQNASLLMHATKSIIAKHDSIIEAVIANYTLSVPERLKVLLKALLFSDLHQYEDGWNRIPLQLSNSEYAAIMGATRVSISRIFTDWMNQGMIRKKNREIFVHTDLFKDVYDWMSE